jgi:hypothetical protein
MVRTRQTGAQLALTGRMNYQKLAKTGMITLLRAGETRPEPYTTHTEKRGSLW